MVVTEGPDVVAAAKLNSAGEPLPKQQRPDALSIDAMLNSQANPLLGKPKPSGRRPSKPRKAKNPDREKIFSNTSESTTSSMSCLTLLVA